MKQFLQSTWHIAWNIIFQVTSHCFLQTNSIFCQSRNWSFSLRTCEQAGFAATSCVGPFSWPLIHGKSTETATEHLGPSAIQHTTLQAPGAQPFSPSLTVGKMKIKFSTLFVFPEVSMIWEEPDRDCILCPWFTMGMWRWLRELRDESFYLFFFF